MKPPASAAYPISITLREQVTSRLMMNLPSTLSATGVTEVLNFNSASERKALKLETTPDHNGSPDEIEHYTLSLAIADSAGAAVHTQLYDSFIGSGLFQLRDI
ncbi:hypothetical protein [Paenibacillus farraposensis]|uniref:hypothetical protein n=1 Tax=Paenibacillus farraposensis TaxID=2807095 RepID=UPI001E317D30|nr:hypothetical protein [Paenibacillus farraposensis]